MWILSALRCDAQRSAHRFCLLKGNAQYEQPKVSRPLSVEPSHPDQCHGVDLDRLRARRRADSTRAPADRLKRTACGGTACGSTTHCRAGQTDRDSGTAHSRVCDGDTCSNTYRAGARLYFQAKRKDHGLRL